MKFHEFDTIRILTDNIDGVKKGEIGAIIMAFDTPKEAYEVEFLDKKGHHKAQCTLFPEDMELV